MSLRSEKKDLTELVNAISKEMKHTLLEKVNDGKTGWQDLPVSYCVAHAMRCAFNREWIHALNFLAFAWFRDNRRV